MERGFLNVWWCRKHNIARTGGPFECPLCKAEEQTPSPPPAEAKP